MLAKTGGISIAKESPLFGTTMRLVDGLKNNARQRLGNLEFAHPQCIP